MSLLDDIIFRDRNRAYGAFSLRRKYPRIMSVAILISISVYGIIFGALLIYYGIPETVTLPKWYQYDNSGLSNPYQPDQVNMPKKEESMKKEKKLFTVVGYKEADSDTLQNTAASKGQDSLGNGLGSSSADTSGIAGFTGGNDSTVKPEMFTHVDVLPLFPGGESARLAFLQKHIQYPEFARKNNIQGPVYVSFIVEKDGSLTHLNILQGIGCGCDEEAIRAVRLMPKWNPGFKKGTPVRVQVYMPVIFTMQS